MPKKNYDNAMVVVDEKSCKVAVFVCTNERPPDKVCCKKVGGTDFYLRLKEQVKAAGLQNTHWVSRSGCLGFCNATGTAVAIFPRGKEPKWFNEVTEDNFNHLWNEVIS